MNPPPLLSWGFPSWQLRGPGPIPSLQLGPHLSPPPAGPRGFLPQPRAMAIQLPKFRGEKAQPE